MSETKQLCPICASELKHGIRIQANEYVVLCNGIPGKHSYIEGIGQSKQEALEVFNKNCEKRQKILL